MITDRVETVCGSLIQHGHHNDRIYVMHLDPAAVSELIVFLDRLAAEHRYGKITAKIPETHWPAFRSAGYTTEAFIPGFFNGRTAGVFGAKFPSARRKIDRGPIGTTALPGDPKGQAGSPIPPATVSVCRPADAPALRWIYGRVFETYPFPIDRPGYLEQMMNAHVLYYCVRVRQQVVAAAAAEIHPSDENCEMTDFATLPPYRGNRFAARLLNQMHAKARRLALKTAFTIARADSPGMNRVFDKNGYRFAGRLVNNTQIDGRIRSMNVWYRRL